MSTPLTDGINALTQYANEITGESDTTLSDAVGSLVEGYGGGELTELSLVVTLNPNSLYNCIFPNTIKHLIVQRSNKNTPYTGGRFLSFLLDSFEGIETITVDYGVVRPINLTDAFRGNHYPNLKNIELLIDTSEVAGWDRFLFGINTSANNIVISGNPINFNKLTTWQNTLSLGGIKEMRFVPNVLKISATIEERYNKSYSDDTWISLVNALNDATSETLTVGSVAQSTISSITGTNDNGTFIADPNGTLTLADFITTVKGWTLA